MIFLTIWARNQILSLITRFQFETRNHLNKHSANLIQMCPIILTWDDRPSSRKMHTRFHKDPSWWPFLHHDQFVQKIIMTNTWQNFRKILYKMLPGLMWQRGVLAYNWFSNFFSIASFAVLTSQQKRQQFSMHISYSHCRINNSWNHDTNRAASVIITGQ